MVLPERSSPKNTRKKKRENLMETYAVHTLGMKHGVGEEERIALFK